MALSQDLISKFAKLTVNKTEDAGATFRGTYKKINSQDYVQIEGSDIWTPVDSTVEAEDGEKVKVTIKDHAATIIGNISSPSARNKSVQDLKEEVDEYGNTIQQLDNTIIQQGNSIIQMNNTINQQGNTINQHDNAIHQQGNSITQMNNSIKQQDNVIDQINNTITQHGDNITSMNNTIQQHNNNINQMNNVIQQQGNTINQQSNTINQQGNTINQQGNIITEQNSKITILNSAFSIVDGRLTGLSEAVIDSLETNHLNAKYANIDFSNIQMAAVTKLFTESGIIKDLVVQAGKITGELVGVTIKGDLIEANSLKADKLVVKGSDGLYYKLNIDGLDNISTSQASKFILTSEKPSDWETNYSDYYIIKDNLYSHVQYEKPRELPSEYENIEYIQTTGTQYINTGVKYYRNKKEKQEMKIGYWQDVGDHCQPMGANYFGYYVVNKYNNKLYYGLARTLNNHLVTNNDYDLITQYHDPVELDVSSKHYLNVNGNIYSRNLTQSAEQNYNYCLFYLGGFNPNNMSGFKGILAQCRLKYYKLYQDDEIVRDFVPCKRLSDNKYGLYDLVNDVFYPNEGTGDFVPGPIMNQYPEWEANTYYKLNPDYESGLDGSNIVAQTITADKIAVTDLVAFGATIGGYHIDQHSLYSGVKTSATNTTRGVFLGDDGQFAVGDNSNFLRFFKDQNNQYKLQLSISNKNIEDEIEDIREHSSQTVISSATEPTDTTKIWYNTTDNHFYHYTETSDGTYDWMTIEEDYSDEFEGIRGSITDARQYAKDLADEITDALYNYMTVSDVDTKIENYDSGIRETFTREINTKTANGNTALQLVNDLKACIERGQDTNGKPFVWLKTGSDEGYKLKIQNDSIVIYKGSTPVSTWLSDKFDVSMVITSTLSLGKFDYVVNSDNSLSFKKVRS